MLRSVEITGFKSFGKKVELTFESPIAAIVGPNGSGKSNVAEALRFVLGEQSMKSLRSKKGEDLIWGGSAALPRQNRASVKAVFDNSSRRLDIDFEEVAIERIVYRDGQNEYVLNGSAVRLKDVIRLLAGANIGGSGYQIISQGEADRILNASPRERREMVEDALGLKLYQHKKAESERKLEETKENIEKVESLRRELAPHLKFLRKQVERIEKARDLKEELAAKLADYLAREDAWIVAEKTRLTDERDALTHTHQSVVAHTAPTPSAAPKERLEEIRAAERALETTRAKREEVMRALGRAEGALDLVKKAAGPVSVPTERASGFARIIMRFAETALSAPDHGVAREHIARIRDEAEQFMRGIEGGAEHDQERMKAEHHVAEYAQELARLQEEELVHTERVRELERERDQAREHAHEVERARLTAGAELKELEGRLRDVERSLELVAHAKQSFEEEVREGIALIGAAIHEWHKGEVPHGALTEPRHEQETRRKAIERLKIKIEEYGAGNSEEVMKEFKQTQERDVFLERELGDLSQSEKNLREIIKELDQKMDEKFTEGLERINEALMAFFTRLFGGGSAKLVIEKPERKTIDPDAAEELAAVEEEFEIPAERTPIAGLAVSVQLPRKKVRGLEVLSGGERALTSIAMIFAMSQVNPPPFLILDETDAALDEANSRRYADMIMELGKRSQLILITHNRATMSAAGELYGVTMGQDGVSRLLSVKLAEAERVAK